MNRLLISMVLVMGVLFGNAQRILNPAELKDSLKAAKSKVVSGKVEKQDTLLYITLDQVDVVPPKIYKTPEEKKQYDRLTRYVKHVYPYALLVRKTFKEIEAHLDSLPDKKAQKKYIKEKEIELRARFEDELVKMTITEGRILIKLVDRETGSTTYEVIKELKGSLSAFFWQSIAVVFGSNLKVHYDAKGEDKMIEDIIWKIENGQL